MNHIGNPWWRISAHGGVWMNRKSRESGRNVQGIIDGVRGHIKVFCNIRNFGGGSDVSYFITYSNK